MSLSKIVLSLFALVSVAHAKPVITTSNVKAYLETVKISVIVDGKWETYRLHTDAFPSPSGEVRLVNPKLVSGRDFYGIELDSAAGNSQLSNARAVLGIANIICGAMELNPAVTRDGLLETSTYASLFKSLRVGISGATGILSYVGQISDSKKPVISSIVCE